MEFHTVYTIVRPIVLKTKKEFYIKLWDTEDWEQEGRLVLFQLLEEYPDLPADKQRLLVYFKVKFRNYVLDRVRKQEALKRRFDRMNHEEIGAVSHLVPTSGLLNDDFVVLRERLREFREERCPHMADQLALLFLGKQFNGRKKLIRELKAFLEEE